MAGGVCCDVPLSRVVPVFFTVFSVFELDPAPCIAFPPALHSLVLCCPLSLCVAVLLCCCAENGRVVCVVCVVSL